jgi:hypothetical protein
MNTLNPEISYNVQLQEQDLQVPLIEFSGLLKFWRPIAWMTIPPTLLALVPGNFFNTPCLFLGSFGAMCAMWRHLTLKKHIQKLLTTPMYNGEQKYSLSESGFRLQGSHFNFESDWSQFVKWADVGTAICLFTSQHQFYVIPKRCLSDSQYATFRNFIATKLEKREKPRYEKLILPGVVIVVLMELGLSVFSIVMTKFGTDL